MMFRLLICVTLTIVDHVLRVHYANGSYSGTKTVERGAAFYAPVITPRDDVMFSFDVFLDDTFDFVKGGKLPGLWGGSYLCSGGRHSDTCFTTRFVWRAGGAGEVYAYMPRDQEPGFCDRSDVYCNLNFGNSLGRGRWQYQKNQWQNVAQFVTMNTPGKHDGFIKVFLDGAMVYEIQNVSLRNNASIHIDGFVFSTFFGGGDVSWASTRSTYSYFRNFVLSTESAPVIG